PRNLSPFPTRRSSDLAQLMKIPLFYAFHRRWKWELLFSTGGMPSSHSAAVTALATSIGISDGFDSHLFAICVVFGIIVMYDATRSEEHTSELQSRENL